ncbi:thiamine transporter 1-like isoform X2 [Rhodnius prolixus]
MENWQKISLILCAYGILKEFRPSEPFVTKYLNNPPMNFTDEQISYSIYPVSIYSSMILLIFVFLITDFLRYKPIIILDSIAGIVVFAMLIICRSLFLVQVLEVFYGLFTACEVAYYTYIYAKVDKEHYQEVSSHTRASYLIGRALSGILSQILVSTGFSYLSLNYFTLGGMILSLVWACILPTVSSSIYFHSSSGKVITKGNHNENVQNGQIKEKDNEKQEINSSLQGFQLLWTDFKVAFTDTYVLKWAFWWALATCGYYQILAYIQLLWEEILMGRDTEYYTKLNGAVEAIYTLMSAMAAFAFGKIKINWSLYGEPVLFLCSIAIGLIVLLMSQTTLILVAYVTYIAYTIIYNSMITIANSEMAKNVNPDSYGLIFGFTLFVALVLQTILTAVVVHLFNLSARKQFEIYSCYFCFLGLIFGIKTVNQFVKWCYRKRRDVGSISA